MAIVYALPRIYEAVVALFTTEGATSAFGFGRRERAKQINQGTGRANRVIFEPGVEGKLGKYAPARAPGRNPRPLATLLETATVYVWAYDGTAPNSELAQYKAVHALHDAVVRAIYLSAYGTYAISDPFIVGANEKTERVFGAEWGFVLEVQSMIPDTPWDVIAGVDEHGEPSLFSDLGYKITFDGGTWEEPNKPVPEPDPET